MGPIGDDIMGFFFVLSGFVVMYGHFKTDFSKQGSKCEFVRRRLVRMYTVFFLNFMFSLPFNYKSLTTCWTKPVCWVLQLFLLDGWAGCGWYFVGLGVSWYFSCVIWMWIAFPFIKDTLVSHVFAGRYLWMKMVVIYHMWGLAFMLLWDYDIQTLSGVPVLRLGDFLLGCGAAVALQQAETPWFLTGNRFWFPFLAIILLYMMQETHHGQSWLCLKEYVQHRDCSLWKAGQTQFGDIEPPCITILEKIPNKYSLIYAGVLFGLGRAETTGDETIWFTHVLKTDVFKTVGAFSVVLYLSHVNMSEAVKWTADLLFGWNTWMLHDDMILFWTYLACYGLHRVVIWAASMCERRLTADPSDEIEMLVVQPLVDQAETTQINH